MVHDRDVAVGPFLPGSPAQSTDVDFSKGLVAGYTTVFSPSWVNNFRYGLTRQSLGINGDSDQPCGQCGSLPDSLIALSEALPAKQ